MKKMILLFTLIAFCDLFLLQGQDLIIKKGVIQDSIRINDTIPETFAVYLPASYEPVGTWPVIFAMDMQGRGKQVIHMFREVAEKEGYIVAASNSIQDSLSIVQNTLIASRMFNTVYSLFPIHKQRTYTAGFGNGAKFASIIPSIIRPVEGVISIGSGIPYKELIDPKKPFQFVGIVGRSDFNFNDLSDEQSMSSTVKKFMDKRILNNYLLVFNGGSEWPDSSYLQRAVEILTLKSMNKNNIPKDSTFISSIYNRDFSTLNNFVTANDYLGAMYLGDEMLTKFKGLLNLDELKKRVKLISKVKEYSIQNRKQKRIFQKEYFIRYDFDYNLNDDVLTLNYNNLGWWNYQMGEIRKYSNSADPLEKEMGMRLMGFINALIEDNINLELAQNPVNEEALSYLWMVKTITAPKEFDSYLKIISDSAKYEDFGTALFYLEELLKNGYKDKSALYSLEHTALLRITPEYNKIIDKYLKDARYEIIEE
ncbi:alpha/beta hydrolase [uncultured Muriicola sp.]|uniref:alpha/beta hydrolase n=1 Tax=uncultured Muriicola sp. TaxID=1583102 RepID=UPI00262DE4FC|nr:alpha/beta hydrolase [uncultured Muriicola sp.]